MIELEIEDAVVAILTNELTDVKVGKIMPNPEVMDNIPFVIVNLSSGGVSPVRMNRDSLVNVEGELSVDVVTTSREQSLALSILVQQAIDLIKMDGLHKIRLSRFTNSLDKSGAQPLYVRELLFQVNFDEDYVV